MRRWSKLLVVGSLAVLGCDGGGAGDAGTGMDVVSVDSPPGLDVDVDAALDTPDAGGLDGGTDAGGADTGCPASSHACGGACLPDDDVASCGDRCAPCPEPATSGAAACELGACVVRCDAGYVASGTDCVVAIDDTIDPPTPIAPRTDARVGELPSFRWALAAGTDGARLEICTDRACADVVVTLDVGGSAATLTEPLALGRYHYRLFGMRGATRGTRSSAAIPFDVTDRPYLAPVPFLDLDGDGMPDAVLGAPGTNAGPDLSRLTNFLGAPPSMTEGTAVTRIPGYTTTHLGDRLAPIGDFDGDGLGDVILGDGFGTGFATLVLFGGSGGVASTRVAGTIGAYQEEVMGIGDVNGDGLADVAWGDPFATVIRVIHGNESRSLTTATTLRSPTGDIYDRFGEDIAPAGDVNGDGYADVLVGAYYAHSGVGEAFLYYGSPRGLTDPTTLTVTDDGPGTQWEIGRGVAGVGDLDADGYDDFVVASAWGDVPSTMRRDDGALYLFRGGPAGPEQTTTTVRGALFDSLGSLIVGAGDVTGDGVPDLLSRAHQIVQVLPGQASLSFGPALSASVPGMYHQAYGIVGDLDGDGSAEFIVGSVCPVGTLECMGLHSAAYLIDGATLTVRQTFAEPAAYRINWGNAIAG